jgi:hypothetical protein
MQGSPRALDTSAEAEAVQLGVYRRMGGAERVAVAFRLGALVREATIAGIRRRHPDYSREDAAGAYRRLILGDALMRLAFPHDRLVEP